MSKTRTKPLRTTELVQVRIPPAAAARMRRLAASLGLTNSDYVATLLRGDKPVARPAAEMQYISLAANRVVKAIGYLLALGADESDPTVTLLRQAQKFIVAAEEPEVPHYDQACREQGADGAWGELEAMDEPLLPNVVSLVWHATP